MDTAKIYHDSEGNECSIWQAVRREPDWAANRIQEGEKAIEKARMLTEWLEWIAAHSVLDTDIPGEGFPYLNMPPNEGAAHAIDGRAISEYVAT